MTKTTIRPEFYLLLLALLWPQLMYAKSVYVNDVLYVPLRGGQSLQHRIVHKGVKSGTRLELLEENPDTGYSRVRTPDDLEGWIQTQYLSETPVARDRNKHLQTQLDEQKKEYKITLSALQKLEDKHRLLQQENVELERIKSLSVDVISVDEENSTLKEENKMLSVQLDQLMEANTEMKNDRLQRWFMAGATTILLGLLFGFWFARRIYSKQQTSGWS